MVSNVIKCTKSHDKTQINLFGSFSVHRYTTCIDYPSKVLVSITRTHLFKCIEILQPKKEFFQIKKSDIFQYFCSKHRLWVLGEAVLTSTNDLCFAEAQSMFLSRNKKNNVYPCKPQIYYLKVRFKGSKLYRGSYTSGYFI